MRPKIKKKDVLQIVNETIPSSFFPPNPHLTHTDMHTHTHTHTDMHTHTHTHTNTLFSRADQFTIKLDPGA